MATSLLLADDSPTIAKILGMALQSEDYEIRSVLTAEDALRELKANPPFFFLVDLNLPEKNGFEFAELIRSDSKLDKIKIVFLASAFDPVDHPAVSASGCDLLITKPFDPAELRSKLRGIRDAPPKFPSGAKVQGSLSGQAVNAAETPPPPPANDASDLLLDTDAGSDANSILEGLLGGNDTAPNTPTMKTSEPPAFSLPQMEEAPAFAPPASEAPPAFQGGNPDATAMLDLSGEVSALKHPETVLDLSQSFQSTTPEEPPPMPKPAEKETGLSANAQALAAFFSAEIDSKAAETPPPAPTTLAPDSADAFDASLESIDWGGGAALDHSLDSWQAQKPSGADVPPPAPATSFPPASPQSAPSAPKRAETRGTGAQSGGAFLFDTGGSNFRFAEDYVHRITKSFTGAPDESVPEKHPSPVFPQTSNDAASQSPAGSWNPVDAQRMEQIVREEVQMAVREVIEKVAWEVIPELAENLIKKELEKVLKQLEET